MLLNISEYVEYMENVGCVDVKYPRPQHRELFSLLFMIGVWVI